MALAFFIMFTIVGSFMFLNLFIAVILESFGKRLGGVQMCAAAPAAPAAPGVAPGVAPAPAADRVGDLQSVNTQAYVAPGTQGSLLDYEFLK